MKKLFIATSIATCVILAVGCATVKENEEKNSNVIDYGTFQKITYTDEFGEERIKYEGESLDILSHLFKKDFASMEDFEDEMLKRYAESCRSKVSVFPNPTSSSATIEIDYWKGMKIEGTFMATIPISFQYNLIFDQKIIHKDYIQSSKTQITISESLLQKEGVCTLTYEFFQDEVPTCKNTISFMVKKLDNH